MQIEKVTGREILDSRGNPTVEAEVMLWDGSVGRAAAPSGASTGVFEALELRDGDPNRYFGKGVAKAVENINTIIAETIVGMDASDIYGIDEAMKKADGTKDKSKLGANAVLAVSMACARAAASSCEQPLFRFLGGISGNRLPVPMMNIINGGAHAKNSIDFQEFMILPVGACCLKEALRMGTEVYHSLKKVLTEKGLSTAVGDEGGFAPDVNTVEEVLDILVTAVEGSGYVCGKDVCFALDVAASEWKSEKGKGHYHLPKSGKDYNTEELIAMYRNMLEKYPILSIEDPLDEEDWEGWKKMTKELGGRVQLVGDDLFVTNKEILKKKHKYANTILIKPNQIGTYTEMLETIKYAKSKNMKTIISHRSGETENTIIADLSVGLNLGQIKCGSMSRVDRTAKYNQLIRIEENER